LKRKEAGYSLVEIVIASAIALVIGAICVMVIYRVFWDNKNVSDRLTVNYQIDRTGYWVSHDVQMANSVINQGLSTPNILILYWTTGYGPTTDYYTVTYSVENISGNVGTLTRHLQNYSGTQNTTMKIAEYVYYNLSDTANTTQISNSNGIINLKVTIMMGSLQNSKTYSVFPRTNFEGS